MTEKKIRYEKPVLTDLTGPEVCKAQGGAKQCMIGNQNIYICNNGAGATGDGCLAGNSARTS
jgi:hypothetical protein